jgi:hypothetical protein
MTVDYRSLLHCADGTIAGYVDVPGPGEGVSRWIGKRTPEVGHGWVGAGVAGVREPTLTATRRRGSAA